jgi:NAD(P)-dependent dehydrogenase (short-subunit alcohol dehydrogenase family)
VNSLQGLFDLTGKAAVVVGAGSGIGRAAALALAAFGARVLCADLRLDAVEQVAAEIIAGGGQAAAAPVDLRSSDSILALVTAQPALDILVCTPAINVRKPMLAMTDDEFDRVVALNLRGNFILLREAGRKMAAQGSGSLIVFSSIRSQVVEPGQSVYAATKAGVVQLVKTLAAELGPLGVRANAIAPGVVETPLTQPIQNNPEWYAAYAAKSVFNRWAQPAEMAGAVVFLASQASSYVTGTVLYVDGGWMAADGRFTPPL